MATTDAMAPNQPPLIKDTRLFTHQFISPASLPEAEPSSLVARDRNVSPLERLRYRELRLHRGSQDRVTLAEFFLALYAKGRARRFQGGVSDDALLRYCDTLDVSNVIALGYFEDQRLRAVVEIHRMGETWRRAELALCCSPVANENDVVSHLAQMALFTAAMRGCLSLICVKSDPLIRVLRQLERCQETDAEIAIDISDYRVPIGTD